MNNTKTEGKRDQLLLCLLKTPPQPRGERKRPRAKPAPRASRNPPSESSAGKLSPSA